MASGDVIKVIGSAEFEIDKITAFSHENANTEKYLHCDGSEISRTTYSELFNVIGTLYGSGNGSTTFNLPDLRGQFLRGYDAGRGVDSGRALGSWQDDATAKNGLSVNTGGGTKYTNTTGNHRHSYTDYWNATNGHGARIDLGTSAPSSSSRSTAYAGNHSHSVNINHSHSISGDAETRPKNVAVKFYIRYRK